MAQRKHELLFSSSFLLLLYVSFSQKVVDRLPRVNLNPILTFNYLHPRLRYQHHYCLLLHTDRVLQLVGNHLLLFQF